MRRVSQLYCRPLKVAVDDDPRLAESHTGDRTTTAVMPCAVAAIYGGGRAAAARRQRVQRSCAVRVVREPGWAERVSARVATRGPHQKAGQDRTRITKRPEFDERALECLASSCGENLGFNVFLCFAFP